MEILENEKNITIIRENENIFLFSYNKKIAIYNENAKGLAVGKLWDYSQTTLKHFKHFVNTYTAYKYESKKQFQKLIEERHPKNNTPIILF